MKDKEKEMTSDKYSVSMDIDREERKVVITLDKEKEVVGINEEQPKEMGIEEKIPEMTSEKEKEDVTEQSSSREKKIVDNEMTHDVDD